MDVHVVSSTAEAYKVKFSDNKSGMNVVIGVSIPLMTQWRMPTDQLMPTMTVLMDEILMSHNMNAPLEPEYMFNTENSGSTLDATIDLIRQKQL